MRSTAFAAVIAAAIAAALLATKADRTQEAASAAEERTPGEGAAARPASARGVPSGPRDPEATPAPSKRARVPAGVLVRAASRRAQGRDAVPPEGPKGLTRVEGDVLSVEIDWHASPSADR